MLIYYCRLQVHDNIFYATREMGILYETEQHLHNWALTYAFFGGLHISQPYANSIDPQEPQYLDTKKEQSLLILNQKEIYVFPAQPLRCNYQVNTFKAAQTAYYGKSKQFGDKGANRNYPINYGRAKEIAVGSEYHSYIMTANPLAVPRWIRLGKWMAKVRVDAKLIPDKAMQLKSGSYSCPHPLNPIDLPSHQQLRMYDRIVMPPTSLVTQTQLEGEHWQLSGQDWENFAQEFPELPEKKLCLPSGMSYGGKNAAHVP